MDPILLPQKRNQSIPTLPRKPGSPPQYRPRCHLSIPTPPGTPILILLSFLVSLSLSVFPQDEIKFTDLGQSFYLKNETYVFQLYPSDQVPLNIIQHVIYTASSTAITSLTKRTISEKRNLLLEFSDEEHDLLARLLFENDINSVPGYIKRNNMKRSVRMTPEGVVVIPLTKGKGPTLLVYDPMELRGQRKRNVQDDIPIGTTFCLNSFWTMCPNDDGTAQVKAALQGATTEMWAELDSAKQTNNQRSISLANTLSSQTDILSEFLIVLSQGTSVTDLVTKTSEQESINCVNQAFGDQVVQSQINYLKRTVNSLLRFSQALAGTDPRQVVAQPSLTELFTGFLAVIQYLSVNPGGYIPIVETTVFNWTEIPLPQDVVHNTAYPPDSYILWDTSQASTLTYPGLKVVTQMACQLKYAQCDNNGDHCYCDLQSPGFTYTYGYFYGPIPVNMQGIYTLTIINGKPSYLTINTINTVYTGTGALNQWAGSSTLSYVWYCIQFGAYKGLATFTTTPYMMNGIPLDSQPLNISECNSMMLRTTPQTVTNTIYSLYVVNENVIIPFFSNCTAQRLITGNFTTSIQSLGYLSQYPSGYSYSSSSTTYPTPNSNDYRLNTDVYQYHMISADCSINLEPEWIGMEYWFSSQNAVISNIPTGFKLNQFTINPAGELSSSLEFVYTSSWVTTYTIQRISQNRIITDEVDLLDGDHLLFLVGPNRTFVIDESNNFYGPGNNGRDCIQKSDTYLYDLTACIFQNNLVDYNSDDYFQGLVQTSGIARYVDKFDFKVNQDNSGRYTFSLIPLDDADFDFYFQPDGTICPCLVNRSSDVSGCSFTFGFNGTGIPQFNNQPLTFENSLSQVTTGFGLFSLTIGNPPQDCMLVYCQFSAKYSTIKFEPPPYTVISASDLALQSQVFDLVDQDMNGTLKNLQDVSKAAGLMVPQFQNFSKILSELNFNVSLMYAYQNFTKEREYVSALINNVSMETQPPPWSFSPASCSDGIFSGIGCFFQNLGGILITVGIIIGVIAGIYLVCFKMGVAKIIKKQLFG